MQVHEILLGKDFKGRLVFASLSPKLRPLDPNLAPATSSMCANPDLISNEHRICNISQVCNLFYVCKAWDYDGYAL